VRQTFVAEEADKPFADRLLSVINTVHGLEGVATLHIERKPLPYGWNGQFDPYSRTATVSPEAPFPLSTGVHEIGHALDAIWLVTASNLGRPDGPITLYASQYAANGRGRLLNWLEAVTRSQPIIEGYEALRRLKFMSSEWEDLQYLLRPAEIWARCYEQFIAQHSRDAHLNAEFGLKRSQEEQVGDRKVRVYWTQEEFNPVEHEIKLILESPR
jgi:hypothetical protein